MWFSNKTVAAGRIPEQVHIYVEGEGCRVTDAEGRSYIDVMSGHMYKNVGHGRKEIVDAAHAQALELASPGYDGFTVPAINLSAKLAQITPGSLSRTSFACGGSEANEIAVKTAKQT